MSVYRKHKTTEKFLMALSLFSLAGLTSFGPDRDYAGNQDYDRAQNCNSGKDEVEGLVLSADYEYSGETVDMKPSGYGTALYKDGRKYTGHWDNGKWNGIGKLESRKGEITFGIFHDGKPETKQPFKTGKLVYGIDVSKYQGEIDWQEVYLPSDDEGTVTAGGGDCMQPSFFALIKATDGKDPDPYYATNYSGAKGCGMVCGAYHFLTTLSPVDAQVEQYITTSRLEPGDLPPVLDMEMPGEIMKEKKDVVLDMALEWLEKIERHYGVRPVIYTFNNFIRDYLDDPRFDKYDLWVSRFSDTPPATDNWDFWQFTDRANVPGITASPADVSIFKGDYHDFLRYVKKKGIK